jgi:hypothetical protein
LRQPMEWWNSRGIGKTLPICGQNDLGSQHDFHPETEAGAGPSRLCVLGSKPQAGHIQPCWPRPIGSCG